MLSDNPRDTTGAGLSTADQLFEQLRAAVIDGGLAPGSRLGEVELARRHGVARSTVREALRRLVERGLASARRNAGARVCTPSRAEMRQLYELRECLEGMVCRLAAQHMSDEAVTGVRALLAEQEKAIDRQAGTAYIQGEHDLDFHCRLAAGSGNAMLEAELGGALYDKLRVYRRQYGMVGPRARPAHEEHRQIVDAIAERDAEMAEMLMRRHIRASLANIERQLGTPAAAPEAVA